MIGNHTAQIANAKPNQLEQATVSELMLIIPVCWP